MVEGFMHGELSFLGFHESAAFLLILVVAILVFGNLRITRYLRILVEHILSSGTPEFDFYFTSETIEDGWLTTTLEVIAIHNECIYLGGRLQVYDYDGPILLDIPLHRLSHRAMLVGQGFRVPVCARLPLDERGSPKAYYYEGYILCSDARDLAHYRVSFGDMHGYQAERVSRIYLLWLRFRERRKGMRVPEIAGVVIS
jgi:hypothetical protein